MRDYNKQTVLKVGYYKLNEVLKVDSNGGIGAWFCLTLKSINKRTRMLITRVALADPSDCCATHKSKILLLFSLCISLSFGNCRMGASTKYNIFRMDEYPALFSLEQFKDASVADCISDCYGITIINFRWNRIPSSEEEEWKLEALTLDLMSFDSGSGSNEWGWILFRVVCKLSTSASEPQRVKMESRVKSEDIKDYEVLGQSPKRPNLLSASLATFTKARLFCLESWTADVIVSDSIKLWVLRAILIEVYACGGQELVQRWMRLITMEIGIFECGECESESSLTQGLEDFFC
ncbi:hypothetical protein M8C21_016013 [Ambrosia artemisiifolia]|uniref:Uncharacterized protein n=1 Tax=Ambrosia artemisiifolia TaxID=4212 RepID=A0AAD5D383_AMBAR|nr:hypothetical protein M8C21_016013 [Ambrosia artemisiifolia]